MYRCIFMFLLLCTSCVEQKDTTSIKIDLMATDSDTLYYSSFVDSLSYIPLETKDDCLIREITDAILTNQYIFILDTPQQSVWIYSTKGKFIRSLHHQGNGPGEYINLIQFEYDADNRELLLLDGWNKSILRYSPDDKFQCILCSCDSSHSNDWKGNCLCNLINHADCHRLHCRS